MSASVTLKMTIAQFDQLQKTVLAAGSASLILWKTAKKKGKKQLAALWHAQMIAADELLETVLK